MKDLIELLNSPGTRIALVGASENPSKYGSIIYRDLRRKGIDVVPVNPNSERIHGDRAYASLAELPQKPDIVNIVTPPEISLLILKECLPLGYLDVWLQPGASDERVELFLKENGFNYLVDSCTVVQSITLNS
jgi:predicted CoA-binding protein